MDMIYKAKPGSWFTDHDAEIIGPELEKLIGSGKGTPDEIVKSASKPESPLHRYYDWDDAIAACKWRKQQARLMVNAIVVVRDDDVEMPAFESVPVIVKNPDGTVITNGRIYQTTSSILDDPEKWSVLKLEIRRDLKAIQRKLKTYEKQASGTQKKLIDDAVEAF